MKDTLKRRFLLFRSPIGLIVLGAMAIGVGNPWFDYPMAFSVGDEFESQRVSLLILKTKSLSHFSTYLPLWSWLQIPFIGLGVLWKLGIGEIRSVESLGKLLVLSEPGMWLFIPRIMSAIISGLSVWFVYSLGKRLMNERFGMWAALFYAVDFFRVQLAHFGRYNSLFVFLSLGTWWTVVEWRLRGERKYLLWSVILLALAIATFPMGLAMGVFWLGMVVSSQNVKYQLREIKFWWVILGCVVFLGWLTYLTPGIWQWHWGNNFQFSSSNKESVNVLNNSWYYFKVLASYMGPMLVFGIFGLVMMWKKRKSNLWMIVWFSASGFGVYLFKVFQNPRSAQWLSFLFIWGAAYLVISLDKKRFVNLATGGLIIFYSALLGLRFNWLFFKPSSYVLAKNFLEEEISSNQPLLIYRNNIYLVPSESAQQQHEHLYQTDYYQIVRPYLKNLSDKERERFSNIKNLRGANNLEYLNKRDDLNKYFRAEDFKYVAIDYFSKDERNILWKKFDMNEVELKELVKYQVSFNFEAIDLLDLNYPMPMLFKINRYGPNYEIFKIANYD